MASDTDSRESVTIAVTGSVDSGKSSFISVLTQGCLDDGAGSARSKIVKHKHELNTGRTSDVTYHTFTSGDKDVTLVDLCGHEKYLKTTMFGITSSFPDYGVLVVAANRGLLQMTKEHLRLLICMKMPFIILITRVDLVTEGNIYKDTVNSIKSVLRKRKNLVFINGLPKTDTVDSSVYAEVDSYISIMEKNHNLVPVVTVSNKTGYYIDVVKHMITNLRPRIMWQPNVSGSMFYIDSTYVPPGVGLVVCGIARCETPITTGAKMVIGPYNNRFIPIRVWSIHDNYRNIVPHLKNKERGCLAIRVLDKKVKLGRSEIRNGMFIMDRVYDNNICYQFTSSIQVLSHSTTITNRYSPVIHCDNIRQTAQIVVDKDVKLKIGDKAEVGFRFIKYPEFMEVGSLFFFREGATRGVGKVTSVLPVTEDPLKKGAFDNKK